MGRGNSVIFWEKVVLSIVKGCWAWFSLNSKLDQRSLADTTTSALSELATKRGLIGGSSEEAAGGSRTKPLHHRQIEKMVEGGRAVHIVKMTADGGGPHRPRTSVLSTLKFSPVDRNAA